MKRASVRILVAIVTFLNAGGVYAQNAEKPAYLNPALPPQQRGGVNAKVLTTINAACQKGFLRVVGGRLVGLLADSCG